MRKFLATTAIGAAMIAGSPAFASSDLTQMFLTEMTGEELQSSELVGMRVYAAEQGVDGDGIMGIQDGWEDVGEINDIVLTRDGAVEAVIVDIGGFLGIGERTVAMKMSALQLVSDEETEEQGDFFIVVPAAAETFEDAPEFSMNAAEAEMEEVEADAEQAAANVEAEAEEAAADAEQAAENAAENAENATENAAAEVEAEAQEAEEAVETAAADVEAEAEEAAAETAEAVENVEAEAEQTTANVEAEAEEAAAETAQAAENVEAEAEETANTAAAELSEETDELTSAVAREGYAMANMDELTTEELTGMRVYDANGEWIGEIGQLNVNNDGQIEHAVIDVGGFLGLGEKPVELELAELDIMRSEDAGELRIEVSKTKEELEAMPTYQD